MKVGDIIHFSVLDMGLHSVPNVWAIAVSRDTFKVFYNAPDIWKIDQPEQFMSSDVWRVETNIPDEVSVVLAKRILLNELTI
jgi:hypothetical protein